MISFLTIWKGTEIYLSKNNGCTRKQFFLLPENDLQHSEKYNSISFEIKLNIIIINFIGNLNIYRENKNKIQSTPKKLCKGSKDKK